MLTEKHFFHSPEMQLFMEMTRTQVPRKYFIKIKEKRQARNGYSLKQLIQRHDAFFLRTPISRPFLSVSLNGFCENAARRKNPAARPSRHKGTLDQIFRAPRRRKHTYTRIIFSFSRAHQLYFPIMLWSDARRGRVCSLPVRVPAVLLWLLKLHPMAADVHAVVRKTG